MKWLWRYLRAIWGRYVTKREIKRLSTAEFAARGALLRERTNVTRLPTVPHVTRKL